MRVACQAQVDAQSGRPVERVRVVAQQDVGRVRSYQAFHAREVVPPAPEIDPDLTIVPHAGHCEAGSRIPGGWRHWAETRMRMWGL